MQKDFRLDQSVHYATSPKPPDAPRTRLSHRLSYPGSLRTLPSVSSPVSFQRLLQVKFQVPRVPSQANDPKSVFPAGDETPDDATTSSGSEPESDSSLELEPAARSLWIESNVCTSQLNNLPSGPTLLAQPSSSDSDQVTPINSQREASIRLAAAGVRKKVVRAEHRLALYIAQEHALLGQLYQELACQVERQATAADSGIESVRHSIQERGFEPIPARPHSAVFSVKKRRLRP